MDPHGSFCGIRLWMQGLFTHCLRRRIRERPIISRDFSKINSVQLLVARSPFLVSIRRKHSSSSVTKDIEIIRQLPTSTLPQPRPSSGGVRLELVGRFSTHIAHSLSAA